MFRVSATWDNSLWYPAAPDETIIRTFPTAQHVARWVMKWGRWLRKIEWIDWVGDFV